MCSDSEGSCAGREEGGLQTPWLAGLLHPLAWNLRFLSPECFLMPVLTPRHAGLFYIWGPMDSLSWVSVMTLEVPTMIRCWGQGFPLSPAHGKAWNPTFPTHTPCVSLQTSLPKEADRVVLWTFQIPGWPGNRASN